MSSSTETPPFAFLAGRLCLDFANTAFREDGAVVWDALESFGDLRAWGVAAEVLPPASGGERPAGADGAFARAVALREGVYRVFAAVAEGRPAPPDDLAALNRALAEAAAHRRVAPDGRGFRWEWEGGGAAPDQVLWRVAESAGELLTGAELGRVRRCAGEDCTRLFLETSRSGRRRWCDMSHCGNLAKVRRYRTRRRLGAGPPER